MNPFFLLKWDKVKTDSFKLLPLPFYIDLKHTLIL